MILLCWTVLDLCHRLLPWGSSVAFCDLPVQNAPLTPASAGDSSDGVVRTVSVYNGTWQFWLPFSVVLLVLFWNGCFIFSSAPHPFLPAFGELIYNVFQSLASAALTSPIFLVGEVRGEKNNPQPKTTTVDSGFISCKYHCAAKWKNKHAA